MVQFLICNGFAQSTPSQQEWEDKILPQLEEMARIADDNNYFTSICIYDLNADALVFGHNEHKKMRPASTQKLVTAISALDLLGANYQLHTDVRYSGEIIIDESGKGTLQGDVYIIGGMDPLLKETDILSIADSLQKYGISHVSGNIYYDESMKDSIPLGQGWCWDDDNPSLASILSAPNELVIDDTNVRIKKMSGRGSKSEGNKLLCSFTHSLSDILRPMMKDSNNQYAECMLYQLGRQVRPYCSFKDCATQIRKIIAKTDQPQSEIEIADGSGLSLYNYITARMEVALLKYASRQEGIFSPLYLSLPVAGQDGTLSSRMRGTASQGNIHAKTGTVSHVISLAGYLTAPTGHILAFSIISNGVDNKTEARQFHDRICNILTKRCFNNYLNNNKLNHH